MSEKRGLHVSLKSLEIKDRRPIANGAKFSSFGAYEAITAEVQYVVDPSHVANSRIVDLQHVTTDTNGVVEFNGNLLVIQPQAQPSCLLVDVPNRGNQVAARMFNRTLPTDLLKDPFAEGDGFLFEHGFTVATIGWQFDIYPGWSICVPTAKENGEEISGELVCQMQPGRDTQSLVFRDMSTDIWPPTGKGRLYRRQHTLAPYQLVPEEEWRFGRIKEGTFSDTPGFICSEKGFKKGVVYTFVYETIEAAVVGLGLCAVRDATAYLKSDGAADGFHPNEHAIAFGASQTGRFLRHFIYEGMNIDESGRTVFDAFIPHIAGGQRGDFNHRFAQPGSMGVPAAGQRFPFAMTKTHDDLTNREAGLRDRLDPSVKVITTNTSWEYWRGDAALAHIQTNGLNDADESDSDRFYMFSGTHHINGVLPLTSQLMVNGEETLYPLNTVSYTPLMRAVLINTLRWVLEGIDPPPSKVPRIEDRTLVDRGEVIGKFAEHADFETLPDPEQLTRLSVYSLGDRVAEGICDFPAGIEKHYPALVSDIDNTYNETAGIRLPEVEIPIGIHTGWNPKHPKHGAPQQTQTFAGFSWYANATKHLPTTEKARTAIEKVTEDLIDARYVLEEDRQLVIDNAMQRFEIASRVNLTK